MGIVSSPLKTEQKTSPQQFQDLKNKTSQTKVNHYSFKENFRILSWQSKGGPQCHPPQETKALVRPYFLGVVALGGSP